ncbi:MAG: sulfur carrier protein ThiS [Zoogloeaceae bacterium]|jgi:sulfur carrier protein|nr:sulfur carrier protein ThiS [Zoogloeaceae bacterium]
MPVLLLNGTRQNFPDIPTLAALVAALGYADKRIAIELNGEIVPKGRYAETGLAEGDALEIVVAVGGG